MMETITLETGDADSNSVVDVSRPFHSVKEAVAIFGKRILLREIPSRLEPPSSDIGEVTSPSSEFTPSSEKAPGFAVEICSSEFMETPDRTLSIASKGTVDSSVEQPAPSPRTPENVNHSPSFSSGKDIPPPPCISSKGIVSSSTNEPAPSPQNLKNDSHGKIVHGNDLVMMLMILKRLESELQETKMELKLLKERESKTEVALASLNAELHKNMSKIAKVEATEAVNAVANPAATFTDEGTREISSRDEGRKKFEVMLKNVDSPTLAQILSISDYDCYFGHNKKVKKAMKKKPIIPLVTDIIPWRKRSPPSNYISRPFFTWQ